MSNIITTIPKSRFPDWATCERLLRRCTGDDDMGYWTIRCQRPPKKPIVGRQCYMIYDGKVRGHFSIVNIDDVRNWKFHTPTKAGKVIVLANWQAINTGPEVVGFQGWRYTDLRE